MQKHQLRTEMLANRLVSAANAGQALARLALADLPFPTTIAGVWPLPGEMDLRPLLHALHDGGHTVVLPQTPPRGNPLCFRIWTPGCPMRRETFGTCCPDGPLAEPDMVFVPLLAFDRAGNRLGYGGGYYDRTLAAHPGRPAIGFGYAAQEVPFVPTEPHDQTLAVIVTEHEVIRTSRLCD